MGTPITWQNIDAPSFADASKAMALAQQSITGAFDGLKTAVTDNEAFNKELWKRQDADFTQRQLAAMYAAKTPEALAALQASGQMGIAVDANGARADMAVINKAFDERPQLIQQRNLQDLKYGEDKLLLEQAGVTAEGLALAQKQDPVAFNAWLAANPQNRRLADVLNMNRTVQQSVEDQTIQNNTDTRADEKHLVDLDVLNSNMLTAESQRNAQSAQANLANAQARAIATKAEEEVVARQAAVDRKILATALQDNPYAGGVLTPGSAEELAKLANTTKLGSGGSPEKLAKTMERLTKIANEGIEVQAAGPDGKIVPKKIPVPLELAKAALLGSSDTLFSWNEGYADTFEETLRKRMGVVKPTLQAPVVRGGVPSAFPALQNTTPTAINPYAKGYADYLKIIDAGASVPSSKKK